MIRKNVIQVGAAGHIGGPILSALIKSDLFNLTILSREGSSSTFPEGIPIKTADYDSHTSLVEALEGQDTVIITTGTGAPSYNRIESIQNAIVNAAVAAGVKHVIPNKWAGDYDHEPGHSEEVCAPLVRAHDHLDSLAKQGKISYTGIATGPFFDWGLIFPFMMVDFRAKKATFIDGGVVKINHTTLDSIGTAVVNAVANPNAVKNRTALIHDFHVTQREILNVIEDELGTQFEITNVDAETRKTAGWAGLLQAGIWSQKSSSCSWGEEDDSKTLGLEKKDLRAEIVRVLQTLRLKD